MNKEVSDLIYQIDELKVRLAEIRKRCNHQFEKIGDDGGVDEFEYGFTGYIGTDYRDLNCCKYCGHKEYGLPYRKDV